MATPNPDLWRCELCRHGPTCGMRKEGTCGYAHSLAEVLPPLETQQSYKGVWRDGVDRFYGQSMQQAQLNRIKEYWNITPECEKPVWARCLRWYLTDQDLCLHPECGWDFGIWQDLDTMKRARKQYEVPFEWARRQTDGIGIWERLQERRDALKAMAAQRIRDAGPSAAPPQGIRDVGCQTGPIAWLDGGLSGGLIVEFSV